ncbi:MAG: membrane protease YdiL (CAAX protease family) [Flavobacteriaceae bacterium]|jgi:membrane protease YdiL (CAAX protease family)
MAVQSLDEPINTWHSQRAIMKINYEHFFGDDVSKADTYKPYILTVKRGFIALVMMHVIQTIVGIAFAYGIKIISSQSNQEVIVDIQIIGMTSVLISGVIVLMLIWLDIRRLGSPFLSQLGFRRSAVSIRKAAFFIFLLLAASHFLAWIYRSFILPTFGHGDIIGSASKLFAYLLETESILGVTGFLSLGLIVGPVMEEIIFRGYLQSSLAKRMPHWIAILITSFVFMLGHGPMILWPMYFGYSLAWGWIYMYTRSLKTAIILHLLSNLFYTFVVLLDWDLLA